MKISIVIPAYNEEKYLSRTLESIASQTRTPDEVIVVDNNSTDKTVTIAKKYGVKVVTEPKQGNVFALKKAMDSATGDIIATTDADTILPLSWVASIEELFEEKDVVCATGYVRIDSNSKFTNTCAYLSYKMFLIVSVFLGKPNISGFCMVVRKSAYEKVGGIDTRFLTSSDVDLGLRLKSQGKVLLNSELTVLTSSRRWKKSPYRDLFHYTRSYIYTSWLRKPYAVAQKPVR